MADDCRNNEKAADGGLRGDSIVVPAATTAARSAIKVAAGFGGQDPP